MRKNGKIELLRFLFSLSVLLFHLQKYLPGEIVLTKDIHFDFFPHGATGVEFFFIVSGFWLASSVFYANEHKKHLPLGDATFLFIKNKYLSLLPMRLMVFVILFVITALDKGWGKLGIATNLLANLPGLLLVQMSGFGKVYLNHVEWYLSVMLIGMLILYPLLRKYYNTVSRIVAPLVAIFVLGYMFKNYGRLTGVTSWEGFCYRSMLRGISELCLGIVCFEICKNLRDFTFNRLQRLLFTGFELLCWIAVFAMVMLTFPRQLEFYILLITALGTICAFSGQSYGTRFFQNSVCFYLGKLSLPIYLCQLIPITLVPKYLGHLPMNYQMWIAFIFTMLLSVLLLFLSGLRSRKKQAQVVS